MKLRFGRQLDWLATAPATQRVLPPLPADHAPTDMYAQIQAGILFPYQDMTHGCLILIAVDRPFAGALLLDQLLDVVTTQLEAPSSGGLVCNVAVSYEGFRALGLTEWQLALFPQEFREGMDARASMLGDFRINHPRRWNLPEINWPPGTKGSRIEMSAVHIVVQFRVGDPKNTTFEPTDKRHPLFPMISAVANDPKTKAARDGIRILHVQELRRLFNGQQVVEHFGFADCISDPVFDKDKEGKIYRNRVQLGEFLVGRDSEADAAPVPHTPEEIERLAWLKDGSFLVVRKLEQHVDRLYAAADAASDGTGNQDRDWVLAKMVGRRKSGEPLAAPRLPALNNDFDYSQDKDGSKCPFHAHIRRGNPRPQEPDQIVWGPDIPIGGRRPRLMRRGMSYGPQFPALKDARLPWTDDGVERGLVFMAYNASIAEQFEVIQRWMTGGNSAGGHSRQSDPLIGVPDWNEQRRYRFEDNGAVRRMDLDRAPSPIEQPLPFVRLDWGLYLLTPSISALEKLRSTAAASLPPTPVWSVDDGETRVQSLLRLEHEQGRDAARLAWKAAVEDSEAQRKYHSAAIWAAIRAHHAGALCTPYGVIVADKKLALDVLADRQGRYSVAGYHERMAHSIGEIYLGLDAGPEYDRQSKVANDAVSRIHAKDAFDLSFAIASNALAVFVTFEKRFASDRKLARWDLDLEASEVVDLALAGMCQAWFGLPDDPDGDTVVPGSWNWEWQDGDPPIYPAHFTAPSRYLFQPCPGADVQDYGERIGKALTGAIARFIEPYRRTNTVPKIPKTNTDAPLAAAILGAFPPGAANDLLTARTFCGVLMGFLPTVNGNVLRSLNEWLIDGTFWIMRAAWLADGAPDSFAKAERLLGPTLAASMQLRPSPELVWRRALQGGFRIGDADVHAGDTVVVSLVSATQQCLDEGVTDVSMVFGGPRTPRADAPTHACPARKAGMGTILGILSSFICAPETCRPALAPLAFRYEGSMS